MDQEQFKLTLNQAGQPDFSKMREQLSGSLKESIYASLPDEYFDNEVNAVFSSMTAPRQGVKSTGEARCDNCRTGYYKNDECPHNLVEAPSEIQEIFYDEFRKVFSERARDLARRWTEGEITDHLILDRLEGMAKAAGQAFLAQTGNSIIRVLMNTMAGEVSRLESVISAEKTSVSCAGCQQPVLKGTQCSCGIWNP